MSVIQPWELDSKDAASLRLRVAEFWLSAPEDCLHSIWASKVGQLTCRYIQELKPSTVFPSNQVQFRDQLNNFLNQGLDQPGAVQVLIATFLFSPPGLFSIQGPERYLPDWLLSDYLKLYNITDQQQEPQLFSKPEENQVIPVPSVHLLSRLWPFPSSLQDFKQTDCN